MPPLFPLHFFSGYDTQESTEEVYPEVEGGEKETEDAVNGTQDISAMVLWYVTVLASMMILWVLLYTCLRMVALRQKTRNQPARRMYVGSRPRRSLGPQEPTIYVSPSNLPPPPKYDFIAPPSYDEVVGTHSPYYQVQPIAQPITAALAQSTSQTQNNDTPSRSNDTTSRSNDAPTVITINERGPTTTVTATS